VNGIKKAAPMIGRQLERRRKNEKEKLYESSYEACKLFGIFIV